MMSTESNATDTSPVEAIQKQTVEAGVIEALRTVFDPEIPVNIYDLGLIYTVDVGEAQRVDVKMTLTSPMCPVAGTLPGDVERKVRSVEGVGDASVEVIWDPPWNPNMMSEAAKLQLGLDLDADLTQ